MLRGISYVLWRINIPGIIFTLSGLPGSFGAVAVPTSDISPDFHFSTTSRVNLLYCFHSFSGRKQIKEDSTVRGRKKEMKGQEGKGKR